MEKWKLAAIAALLLSFIGYGVFANSTANRTIGTDTITNNPSGAQPAIFTPPLPSKYDGKTFPAWPSITTWANSSVPVKLGDSKGQLTLVEVFRIECSHCQDAAPFLVRLHARYAPRGVKFVGIQSPSDNPDPAFPENSWPEVQSWVKSKSYTWPVGFDPKRTWFKKSFGNNVSYPSLFLLDKNGVIIFFQSGHDEAKGLQLTAQLERLAPGNGDARARSIDLVEWIEGQLKSPVDAKTKQQLEKDISSYLGSKIA